MSVIIPSAGAVGSVFAVPASDWSTISSRVAIVIEAQPVGQYISQYVPNYSALLGVCEQWKPQTFPGLLSQAYETGLFANQAAGILTQLSHELQPLKPTDPLPDSVRFIFTVQFAALRDTASSRITDANALTPQIQSFVTQNRLADAAIAQYASQLGPDWQAVEGPIQSLEGAMSDVQSGWGDVMTAFATAASSQDDLTTAALLAADVQSAIVSWQAVATAATSFDRMTTGQGASV